MNKSIRNFCFFMLIAIAVGSTLKAENSDVISDAGVHIKLTPVELRVNDGDIFISAFRGVHLGSVRTEIKGGLLELVCSGPLTSRRCSIEDSNSGHTLDSVVFSVNDGKLAKL